MGMKSESLQLRTTGVDTGIVACAQPQLRDGIEEWAESPAGGRRAARGAIVGILLGAALWGLILSVAIGSRF